MASIRILVIVSTLVRAAHCGFVNVECKTKTVGQYGQQIMVDCVVQVTEEASDLEIQAVNWKKNGVAEPLLHFYGGEHHGGNKRFSFAEPSWDTKNKNVSLLIRNAAVEDEGSYTCTVVTTSGDGSKSTSLEIRAKYSRPTVKSTPEKITRHSDGVLTCSAAGGYPRGELRWYDEHGKDWTRSSKMEAEETEDGRFHLSSNLTLLRGSIFSMYVCMVYNHSGGKEDEVRFEINTHENQEQDKVKEMNSASKIVAPVVVIGSLIVGLLIVLVIRRRRSRHEPVSTCEPVFHAAEKAPDVENGFKL